jgi:AI-2 transport protein TqsA
VLGLASPALLALLEGGARPAILVIVAYSVINVVIQSLIQPKFVGDTVGLSATLTFCPWCSGPTYSDRSERCLRYR